MLEIWRFQLWEVIYKSVVLRNCHRATEIVQIKGDVRIMESPLQSVYCTFKYEIAFKYRKCATNTYGKSRFFEYEKFIYILKQKTYLFQIQETC